MIARTHQDLKGFYQVGDFDFYSKLDAIHHQQRTGGQLRWIFNDTEFGSHDWLTEPVTALPELYRERAQQLRDRYDYLILWFSGGADSTNVLTTFIDNGILLDEVASFVNHEATKDRFNYMNAEIFHVAVPKIQAIHQTQTWPHHRLIDTSQLTMDRFMQAETKFDWVYLLNNAFNPNHTGKQNIKLLVPEWRKMFDAGKRVGFIYGMDKPRVTNVKDRYFFRFADMTDIAVSPAAQIWNRPWDFDEFFYWSPDLPSIVIKQAHVIKRHLKGIDVSSQDLTDDQIGLVSTTKGGRVRWLKMDRIHQLIYPGWYPVPYQSKPSSLIYSPRDTWFFDLPDWDPAKRAWRVGLEHMWQSVDDRWKRDPAQLAAGLKLLHSKPYDLGI